MLKKHQQGSRVVRPLLEDEKPMTGIRSAGGDLEIPDICAHV
jgi:hypothetical protein